MNFYRLAENRNITILFLKLSSLVFKVDEKPDLERINNSFLFMQKVIFKYEGVIRQFLVDDKGTVLIAVFGVPPFSHDDDAERGVKTALEIVDNLQEKCHIGITTGPVFTGSVGSSERSFFF